MSDDAFEATFTEDKSAPAVVDKPVDQGPEQPRGPDGKFAAKADAPAVTPEPVTPAAPVAPPAEPAKPDPVVESKALYLAMMDEREKRQKFERELAELRAQQQPRHVPSVTEDPEAFAQYQQQLIQQTATNTRFETSELVARQAHGDEPVQKAMDWALTRSQESPAFAHEYLKQKHPIDWAVRQHKRDALLKDIGEDPEAYRARIIAEFQAANAANQAPLSQQAPASPQPAAPKPTPRPSLASAPTAGGIQTVVVKEPFEAAFK